MGNDLITKISINRREFLQGLIASGLVFPNLPLYQTEQESFNVVILMSDEHNPKYSSVYGHPFIQTPNMERIAREGVVFENAYCPSPLCMPSRSSFMSGLYNHETQCYSNCTLFLDEFPNYGQVLSQQGVYTAYFGKADVYRRIEELGFNETVLGKNRGMPGDICIERKPLYIRKGSSTRSKEWGLRWNAWQNDFRVVDKAIAWLKYKASKMQKTFVTCINIEAPHFPHYARQEFWNMYDESKGDLPRYGPEQPSAQHPYAVDLRRHFETDSFQVDNIKGLRRGYYACVSYVDSVIGQILDTLEETGLKERTVFIYTSDHGEMLGKFGMWWKCSMFEDSARVPVLACGPGFGKGLRISAPITLLDVQSSLFHATKCEQPENRKGSPLQELKVSDKERFAFAEYHGHGTRGSSFMVRKGVWKFVWNSDAPHQLFNLDEDPEELNNLMKNSFSNSPEIARELYDYLYSICDPVAETQNAEAKIQKQLEKARKMGYIS